MIQIQNLGTILVCTNYWESELAAKGYFFLAPNAGCFRLLIPQSHTASIGDMRDAKKILLTVGIHAQYQVELTEILFDDNTANPYVLYIPAELWLTMPAQTDYNKGYEFTAWESRRGQPHKVLSRPSWLRKSPLPCLDPWPK